jgi:hypothetical protein
VAVCTGGAGLAPEDRAELLAILARDPDENLAERAAGSLLSIPPEAFVEAASRPDAAPQLLEYCAAERGSKPGIADALAKNPNCPPSLLIPLAKYLSLSGIQALMENVEKLSETPELVSALLESNAATLEQKSALQELLKEDGDSEALRDAIREIEPDQRKRETLLQRLAKMRVIDRIKLAMSGGQTERLYLIRDPNKMVQRAVLQSPRLSEREVEGFASMANLSDEILRLIAGNRAFIKNYIVAKNLINNPKTPLDISLHLLPRLNPSDLKFLTMNKNIPETLRTTAMKLQRQRAQAKKGPEG